jgi:hypothetical protein
LIYSKFLHKKISETFAIYSIYLMIILLLESLQIL